ncbi:MAG: SdpI family protein [Ignavibacteriales bacterium]|nr:SdpI family protein [Ignavibacteriales bacterium]
MIVGVHALRPCADPALEPRDTRTSSMSQAMLPAMGLLFIVIGSMLRKAKRNFFIGIRTPWTLSSDYVWDKTHQLGCSALHGSRACWQSLAGSSAG